MRALRAVLGAAGWALLGALALCGVALSALVAYAASPFGRGVVASALVRLVDAQVAGSLSLGAVELRPGGAIAIHDFKAYDPDGQLVLQVDRLAVSADLTRLRRKVVGVQVELDGADVLADEDAEGGLSLSRAFAPAHPSPPRSEPRRAWWRDPLSGWTVRLGRLTVRDAGVWWRDADGRTRLELQELSLDARALAGPHRTRLELDLRGQALAPVPGPLSLEVRALVDDDRIRLPVLRAQLAGTGLAGLGELDLGRWIGRAALTRATLDRADARTLVKGAPAGADLSLDAYAEADGSVATAAVHLTPGKGTAGAGDAAVAARVDGARALGFDVVLRELDPSALHAAAPAGRITLSARGGLAGRDLAGARGAVDLALSPSRLRAGEVGPAAVTARLDRGSWEAPRISLTAPGLRVEGAGSWRQGGAATARLDARLDDLARAADNAGKLLGVALPRLSGRGRVEATLSGTAAAPSLTARVDAPALSFGATGAAGVQARLEAAGPFRPGRVQLEARLQRLTSGGRAVAQELSLRAAVAPVDGQPGAAEATLSATGQVPSLGKEPVSTEVAATLAKDRRTLRVSRLSLTYPGTSYALEAPATVALAGPKVDRLALAAGPRRIALEGGLGPRGALDARVEVVRLDLARLPAGLLPAGQAIAGELTAEARATGTTARPQVEARLSLQGAGFRTEQGDTLQGTARWDGAARRAGGHLTLSRPRGGAVEVEADLPVPLRGRRGEAVSATVRTEALPLVAILDLAGGGPPVGGKLTATVRLSGTAGAPALRAELALAEGVFRDLEGIEVAATADVAAAAEARADVRLSGKPAAQLTARAPLSLAALLDDPGRAAAGLEQARATVDATLPGLELAALAGRLGVPEGLKGRLSGEVHLSGPAARPRGTADLSLADGAYRGYTAVAGRVEAAARDQGLEVRAGVQLHGHELLRLTASLGAPPERLAERAGREAAPLRVDAAVPSVDLGQAAAAPGLGLGGVVEARLQVEGTPLHPTLQLRGTGRGVALQGRPLGQVEVSARAAGDRATAELTLAPPAGGKLTATAALTAPISLELRGEALRRAPAQLALRAEAVELGFLPALLPGLVRSAEGRLEADLTASGPLADLSPRGTARIERARLGLAEYGEWTAIGLEVAVSADAIELRRLEAHRGEGSLLLRAALRGLTGQSATLDGSLDVRRLTLARAGMDLATVTTSVKLSGTYRDRRLDARLDVPEGLVRLADKLPRELQSLEQRKDIVIGPKPPRKPAAELGPAAPEQGKPFALAVRLVAPGRFLVQRVSPRINVELRADVTYEHQGQSDLMTGSVEVVRGFVEPLGDRRFEIRRARLTFSGGPPSAAVIDAEAVWDATQANAVVTVSITGPVTKPTIVPRSQPPMDQGQIAMLIATGQTELRAGGAGGAAASQSGATQNAAQKVGFAVFNTFIRDQLPFSSGDVSLDASAAKVSGYIPGTKIYVGFTRRFDANREQGENEDEVRMEYAITPHWTLEGRWGNANTGGASLIWSKDY